MDPILLKAGFILTASVGFLLLNTDSLYNFSKNLRKFYSKKKH